MQMSVNEWIEPFIANLGHPFMELAVNSGIAPGIRNVLSFLIRDAKSCIDCDACYAIHPWKTHLNEP